MHTIVGEANYQGQHKFYMQRYKEQARKQNDLQLFATLLINTHAYTRKNRQKKSRATRARLLYYNRVLRIG